MTQKVGAVNESGSSSAIHVEQRAMRIFGTARRDQQVSDGAAEHVYARRTAAGDRLLGMRGARPDGGCEQKDCECGRRREFFHGPTVPCIAAARTPRIDGALNEIRVCGQYTSHCSDRIPGEIGTQLGRSTSSGVLSVRIPRKLGCRSRPSPLVSGGA